MTLPCLKDEIPPLPRAITAWRYLLVRAMCTMSTYYVLGYVEQTRIYKK